jgi:uncharacterized protein YdiU (UPF0061 family)
MRDKLGLFSQQKGDNDLLDGLFALMIREKQRLYPDVPPAEPQRTAQRRLAAAR